MIGPNIALSGRIEAKIHYDLLMHGATLLVDWQTVPREGGLAFE